ncbi:MAG: carboxypeptidase-like regulatory domain-containing protein [Desulfobulbaceae bacterium]|nr:carboxypeptidase-like regulatory domain-containing protein [Desulfobulbaceae bacterium]
MKIVTLIIVTILFAVSTVYSAEIFVVEGNVLDATNGKAIPGASIRISGTNRGTYSSSKGFFRLSVNKGETLIVRSLGYSSDSLIVKVKPEKLELKLKPVPIVTGNVNVTAAITPEQIIERAVKKRDENKQKLRTFSGELYSKLVMELDGSLLSISTSEDGKVSLGASVGIGGSEEPSDSKKYIIMETYSTVQTDYEKKISKVTINKRRQTANIPSEQNIMAITQFVSFYDDEITFLKTTMPSPIGNSALSDYNYTLKDRIIQNDRYIYVLNVEPKSKIYPRFVGEIRIIEETYNIVELELSPSSTTAIPFFEDLAIKQKYSESEEKVWYPAFLEVSAKAKVEVVSGLLDFSTDVKATSIFSDANINVVLPDSIYTENVRRITVSELADTRDSLFWEQNSMRELSDREIEIYAKVDSAVALDSVQTAQTQSNVNFSWMIPYIDFNRVSSVSLGLKPSLEVYGFNLNSVSYFSFGLQDVFGSIQLELPPLKMAGADFLFSAKVFSVQDEFGHSIGQYPRLFNTVAAALVHEDYNDYYQNDGFGLDLNINSNNLKFALSAEFSRNFSLDKTTNASLFEDYEWRNHPKAIDGDYRILRSIIAYGKIIPIMLPETIGAEINIDAFGGQETKTDTDFGGISGRFIVSIPTFKTGYGAMKLMLSLSGGIATDDTPVQYQHRMATRLFILNNVGNFYTAPLGFYGGNKYYSVQALYNLSDIWWRWIGLPTYEGRGPELTIGGTYGVYYNNSNSFYRETGSAGYSEAGFGLSRLPTFFSNVFYWSFDVRFGIGPNAKGRTGGALSVAFPF